MAYSLGNPSLIGDSGTQHRFSLGLLPSYYMDHIEGLDRQWVLRVSEEHEITGLDTSQHGEAGYSLLIRFGVRRKKT